MKSRNILILLLKLVVSSTLIWLVYRHIPVERVREQIGATQGAFLPFIFAMLFINTSLSALKWQWILAADSVALPFPRLLASYLVGTFFNIFLPSNIGGDAYRIYDVARASARTASSVASVMADRLSGFLALAILALAGALAIAGRTHAPQLILCPLLALLALAGVVAALYFGTPVRRVLAITRLDRVGPLQRFMDKLLASFAVYRDHPGLLTRIMGLSFLFQASAITCVYLMARSLGVEAYPAYFCAFVPLISLLEALPISIYGIGVRDAGYVWLFSYAGVGDIQTRALAILYLGLTVGYSLLGGFVLAGRWLRPSSPAGEGQA
jgi:hypothetical protein